MRLKNCTNFSDDKIREIIDFVRPNQLFTPKFDVKVANSSYLHCGRFFRYGGYSKSHLSMGSNWQTELATVGTGSLDAREIRR